MLLSIQRFVSFYKGKGDKSGIKGTILGALKISLPMSIIFASIFFFYADWISTHVFHLPELTPVLRIFSIAIPFSVLANNLISATIGFQDIRYRVYVNDLFQNIFKLAAIVALFVLGFEVIGAITLSSLFSGEKIFSVIVNQMLHTSASSHTHLEIDHPALDVGHHCMLR